MCLKRESGNDSSVRVRRKTIKFSLVSFRFYRHHHHHNHDFLFFSPILNSRNKAAYDWSRFMWAAPWKIFKNCVYDKDIILRFFSYAYMAQLARWWDENTWDFQLELILQLWNVLQKKIFGLKTWDSFAFFSVALFFIPFLVERRRIRIESTIMFTKSLYSKSNLSLWDICANGVVCLEGWKR